MIYTRFGSPIRILSAERDLGTIYVQFKRLADGSESECSIYDLKADAGAPEIQAAILAVSPELADTH